MSTVGIAQVSSVLTLLQAEFGENAWFYSAHGQRKPDNRSQEQNLFLSCLLERVLTARLQGGTQHSVLWYCQ